MDHNELEVRLIDKVNKYGSKHLQQSVSQEEVRCAVRVLLYDDPDDLGGLTALRGFIYQYYVAIHYMVEMLHAETAWWNEVIFELLDDIALFGKDKIRFVQVKTVREDGQDRHLIPSTLYKRDTGLDSWLDTLFSNIPQFEKRQLQIHKQCKLNGEFGVQFEIATNAPYDNKGLKGYAQNDTYQLVPYSIAVDDAIVTNLKKPYVKTIKENNKIISTEELHFYTNVGKDPVWCLERFYLNHLGCMSNLKEKIVGKLSDYCKRSYSFQNAFRGDHRLSGDSLLFDYIARKVFRQLLLRVVERTHKDDLPDKMLLVFQKDEIIHWVHDWQQQAMIEIQREVEQTGLRKQFVQCFEELHAEIDSSWNPALKTDLIQTLSWIYNAIEDEVANGNPFVYEQFYNRLFFLHNSQFPSSKRINDGFFLKESLKYMMICLAFYPNRSFLFPNAQCLFKQGKQGEDAWSIFMMYNARAKESYSQAKRKVVARSKDCEFMQHLQQPFYCFVTHEDKEQSPPINDDPFASVIPITKNHERSEDEIIEQPQHIKFQTEDKLTLVIQRFNEPNNKRSFQDHELRKGWHILLNNSQ